MSTFSILDWSNLLYLIDCWIYWRVSHSLQPEFPAARSVRMNPPLKGWGSLWKSSHPAGAFWVCRTHRLSLKLAVGAHTHTHTHRFPLKWSGMSMSNRSISCFRSWDRQPLPDLLKEQEDPSFRANTQLSHLVGDSHFFPAVYLLWQEGTLFQKRVGWRRSLHGACCR